MRWIIITLAAFLLVIAMALVVSSQSQPPGPSAGKSEGNPPQSQPATDKAEAKPDLRGTEEMPAVVRIAKTPEEAAQDQTYRDEEATSKRWTIWLSGLTLFVLMIQSYVLWRQNSIMDTQTTLMTGQLTHTETAARAAVGAVDTNREVERAYISINHGRVNRANIDPRNPLTAIKIAVQARNFGRSPGQLLGGFVGYSIGQNPSAAEMNHKADFTPAILMPTDQIEIVLKLSAEDDDRMEQILTTQGGHRLWLIGEVDYTDRFGGWHKGGWGRAYRRKGDAFVFTKETGRLNYDKEMTNEERQKYRES